MPADLCGKVQKLMHEEAQRFGLSLRQVDTGYALFTTKALRDGDPICDITALWYSTKDRLKHVLSQDGNKAMLDKLMLVEGLYNGEAAAPPRVFGIRVGVAAFARHYMGVRKGGPNAKVVINSSSGFTPHLASLVVDTRNNLGISQDTEICMNYGAGYDFGVLQDIQESPCKKFKGALESLFVRQQEAEQKQTPAAKGEPTSSSKGEPPAKKLRVGQKPETNPEPLLDVCKDLLMSLLFTGGLRPPDPQ